jgi:threonine dehydrogenase-like Zn-dependent dehydrogenase
VSTGDAWRKFAPPQANVGYSHVGDVVDVGEGVDRSWLGQRVATTCPHAAYATTSVAPVPGQRSGIVPVPADVTDQAATLGSLAAVAMNAIRRGSLVFGESVVVVGLGLLGQLAARICAVAGAQPIFAVNRSPDRLRWLRGPIPITGSPAERAAVLVERNRGHLADMVIEASGDPQAITEALALVRPQGRLVIASSPRGETHLDLHDLSVWPSVSIIGAHMRSHPQVATPDQPWTLHRHVALFLDLVAAGTLVVDDLISDVIPAPRAPEAYALLANRRDPVPMGVCLEWA